MGKSLIGHTVLWAVEMGGGDVGALLVIVLLWHELRQLCRQLAAFGQDEPIASDLCTVGKCHLRHIGQGRHVFYRLAPMAGNLLRI